MRGIKQIRLPGHDYRSSGYYFVTVNANWKETIFWDKRTLIEKILRQTIEAIPGVTLDVFNIRSNHAHFIIELCHSSMALGEIVRRFKAKVSYTLKISAWQPNYYERIIISEESLNRVREYIMHNDAVGKNKGRGYF